MKRIKNIFVKSCLFSILLTFSGCNSWLDIAPVGVQTSDTYWQTKEEAEQVLISSYIQLRECLPFFFKWGELRADALSFGSTHSSMSGEEDERLLRMLDIRPSNSLTEWSGVYTAIGRANSVIKFAPKTLETDLTFSPELCNSYIAEAVFIRSLCYFYLVRTFRDVPHITEPYADDSKTFLDSLSDGNDILDRVIVDLKEWEQKCKPGYEEAWQTKGRATNWAFYALMADIYLWQEDYTNVRAMYQRLKNGGFSLVQNKKYFTLFYPGNCQEESIFELQFRGNDDMTGQGNSLYEWFNTGDQGGNYIISESSKKIIDRDEGYEVRGTKYMYDDRYSANKYFKYVSINDRFDIGNKIKDEYRPEKDREPNWIFYRFADIVLMEAEAMTMLGVPYNEVCTFLDETIRKRAGLITDLTTPINESGMLTIILDERLKEFMAEGKRWFDILRVAKSRNYEYRSILIDELSKNIPSKDLEMWRMRLLDEYSHYLPINKGEIEASYGTLPQNPFYKNVE